jgi:glyoxylase-like metal-dependent hydrolase (beta-lactamase superfamily II)
MILQIQPRVFQLRAFGAQVFALVDDRVTLVDTGAPGSGRLILRQLSEIGVSPGDVKQIVLTHFHVDHRGAAGELREATGASVYIHRSEAPYLRGHLPFPNPLQHPALATLTAPIMAATRLRPVPVEDLDDDEVLDSLGGIRVIHAPGHTRGSISLWFKETGLLFAGDAMQFRGGRLQPPARLVTEDMGTARASLRRLAGLGAECLCFSHFPALRSQAGEALKTLTSSFEENTPPTSGESFG